jgi:hypothetical protein
MIEVTPDGNVVWQFNNPNRARGGRGGGGPNGRSIFRVYRFGPDFPGLADKELTPGKSLVELAEEARGEGEEEEGN